MWPLILISHTGQMVPMVHTEQLLRGGAQHVLYVEIHQSQINLEVLWYCGTWWGSNVNAGYLHQI